MTRPASERPAHLPTDVPSIPLRTVPRLAADRDRMMEKEFSPRPFPSLFQSSPTQTSYAHFLPTDVGFFPLVLQHHHQRTHPSLQTNHLPAQQLHDNLAPFLPKPRARRRYGENIPIPHYSSLFSLLEPSRARGRLTDVTNAQHPWRRPCDLDSSQELTQLGTTASLRDYTFRAVAVVVYFPSHRLCPTSDLVALLFLFVLSDQRVSLVFLSSIIVLFSGHI